MASSSQSCSVPIPFLHRSTSAYGDRAEAGRVLATALAERCTFHNALLLALPRGGVPVACEMSIALKIPVDIFLVRKFAMPNRPEMVLGTVASGGVEILSDHSPAALNLEVIVEREHMELARRERSYRNSRSPEQIQGRPVIVVDDGLTTGSTMRSAIRALRHLQPVRIIAAVPVASPEVCAQLEREADAVVCARMPDSFSSVRRCYRDFSPVLDSDIRSLLDSAAFGGSKPPTFRA